MKYLLCFLLIVISARSEKILRPVVVSTTPESESTSLTLSSAWFDAEPITIRRIGFDTPIKVSSLIYEEFIYFQIVWKDESQNNLHKPWRWDGRKGVYIVGSEREDNLIMRWEVSRELHNRNAKNDLWYWGSVRTKSFADDMSEIITENKYENSLKKYDFLGRDYYWRVAGDSGLRCYKTDFKSKGFLSKPRYLVQTPSGSRGDVGVSVKWENKEWTLEFKRRLTTGHIDDVDFLWGKDYYFDVAKSMENAHVVNNREGSEDIPIEVFPLQLRENLEYPKLNWYEYSEVIADFGRKGDPGVEGAAPLNARIEECFPVKMMMPKEFHERILEDIKDKNEKN